MDVSSFTVSRLEMREFKKKSGRNSEWFIKSSFFVCRYLGLAIQMCVEPVGRFDDLLICPALIPSIHQSSYGKEIGAARSGLFFKLPRFYCYFGIWK